MNNVKSLGSKTLAKELARRKAVQIRDNEQKIKNLEIEILSAERQNEALKDELVLLEAIENDCLTREIATKTSAKAGKKRVPKRGKKRSKRPTSAKASRIENEFSMPQMIAKAVEGKGEQSIEEITQFLVAAGHKFPNSGRSPREIVGIALANQNNERRIVKRSGKGMYVART